MSKYGYFLWAPDGQTVMIDERGLLQTWQEGRADNLDATNPLILNIYLPAQTNSVHSAILRFKRQAFRAYETAAASGGGATSGPSSINTTASGGGDTSSEDTTQEIWSLGSGVVSDMMRLNGSHVHGGQTSWTIPTVSPDHQHDYRNMNNAGSHAHILDRHRHPHSHTIPNHTHGMNHNHSTPDHVHGLVFGIYTGQTANGITIKINGTDRTGALGGPFNSDQSSLNIAQYLNIGQWNSIELGIGSGIGRIDATIFLQALMGV